MDLLHAVPLLMRFNRQFREFCVPRDDGVPPPDVPYPDIIEWSKPLPSEQWAKRSPELEEAIAKREAELAAQAEQALLMEQS
ncbi:hypothetical protein ACYZT7_01790 [Pseudomonas sp. RT4P38]